VNLSGLLATIPPPPARFYLLPDRLCRRCGGLVGEGPFGDVHVLPCLRKTLDLDDDEPCTAGHVVDLGHDPVPVVIGERGLPISGCSPRMRFVIRPVYGSWCPCPPRLIGGLNA
jgi:hypothetical protein